MKIKISDKYINHKDRVIAISNIVPYGYKDFIQPKTLRFTSDDEKQMQEVIKNANWESFRPFIKDNDLFICTRLQALFFKEVINKKFPEIEIEIKLKYDLTSSFEKDKFRGLLGYELDKKPITEPIKNGVPVPFIDGNENLIICDACDDGLKYWKNGMSIEKVIEKIEIGKELKERLIKKYVKYY